MSMTFMGVYITKITIFKNPLKRHNLLMDKFTKNIKI